MSSRAWDSHHVGATTGKRIPPSRGSLRWEGWEGWQQGQGEGLVEKEKPQCLSAMAEKGLAWLSVRAVPARAMATPRRWNTKGMGVCVCVCVPWGAPTPASSTWLLCYMAA